MGGYDDIPLPDVLEPLFAAADDGDAALGEAVTEVAEMLAVLGALVVDRNGDPVPGATDEMAVLGALGSYGRMLLDLGHTAEAAEVSDLMERIDANRPRPPPRSCV
ncbi:hypothetical protein [Azospirillum halopraeferens]|uniref:hypothetical protein n=1 Tax=Azospirillum halopraeferens TaxID=34010 RepID=UPI0004087E14|nr:hypothetical protein [Azospirillum halopraeferens]